MAGKFDVLLYGATGFTGKLAAAYLDEVLDLKGRSWAIAGRTMPKLTELLETLGSKPSVVHCDLGDAKAVEEMVKRTRVVLNCAGPYSVQNGEALLGECARQGVHYSDLAGEGFWQREMIDKFHDVATRTGSKIVLGGGVDSIPSDLGTHLALAALKAETRAQVRIQGVYTEFSGAFSGGTLASGRAGKKALAEGRKKPAMDFDPYLLAPGTTGADSEVATRTGMPVGFTSQFDSRYGAIYDFFMAPINGPIVRRSLALRGLAQSCSYSEVISIGAWLRVGGYVLSRGAGYFVGQPINFRPEPGEGPPPWLVKGGAFSMEVTATSGERCARATISGKGDPGYGATAKMLSETGLCMAFDLGSAPASSGVLTPAIALGDTLVARLGKAEGGNFMSLTAATSP